MNKQLKTYFGAVVTGVLTMIATSVLDVLSGNVHITHGEHCIIAILAMCLYYLTTIYGDINKK